MVLGVITEFTTTIGLRGWSPSAAILPFAAKAMGLPSTPSMNQLMGRAFVPGPPSLERYKKLVTLGRGARTARALPLLVGCFGALVTGSGLSSVQQVLGGDKGKKNPVKINELLSQAADRADDKKEVTVSGAEHEPQEYAFGILYFKQNAAWFSPSELVRLIRVVTVQVSRLKKSRRQIDNEMKEGSDFRIFKDDVIIIMGNRRRYKFDGEQLKLDEDTHSSSLTPPMPHMAINENTPPVVAVADLKTGRVRGEEQTPRPSQILAPVAQSTGTQHTRIGKFVTNKALDSRYFIPDVGVQVSHNNGDEDDSGRQFRVCTGDKIRGGGLVITITDSGCEISDAPEAPSGLFGKLARIIRR